MRMALKNKAWKANATLLAVCAGLAGVMCGCGDDTVGGTSGEGPTTDASATDAPVDSTTTTPDTGATPDTGTTVVDATTDSSSAPDTGTTVVDSSTPDTGIVDSSTAETSVKDTGAADVAVTDATSDAADSDSPYVPRACYRLARIACARRASGTIRSPFSPCRWS